MKSEMTAKPPDPLKGEMQSNLYKENLNSPFRGQGGRGLHILLLVIITLLLYWRSVGNEFLMIWDDQWQVFNSYTDTGFSAENISRILTHIYYGQYSPLNQLVYTLLYYISGYNSLVYHGFCVLLHVLNVVIAYLFLDALLTAMHRLPCPLKGEMQSNLYKENLNSPFRGQGGHDHSSTAAFIGALLFAVHPVNVEAVSWVSASKIVLCSFNYLLGLYLYVRYTGSRSRLTYLAVLLLFALAFGAKEQAVAYVLCCMVIDYAVKRRERLSDLIMEKLPMIFLALFFGVVTMITHWYSGSGRMPVYDGPADRIVLASYSLYEYIVKTILPCKLTYVYPFPYQPGENIPLHLWIYPVLVVIAGCLVFHYRRNRLLVFAVLFFLANLVLMLHFIPMSRFTVTCDRYLYVALLGPAALAGWWAACGLRSRRVLTLAILIPYLLYLSAYTFTYQGRWDNSTNLKRHVREVLRERAVGNELISPHPLDG